MTARNKRKRLAQDDVLSNEKASSKSHIRRLTIVPATDDSEPAAQSKSPLFRLPAELRNEIYLLVASDRGLALLRNSKDRNSCTSQDPISLACKAVRWEYLDVLAKKARTLVACSREADGFCNTVLLSHRIAYEDEDVERPFAKWKKLRKGKGRKFT